MNKHPKLSFGSVRHLEIQPCWTAPGQVSWLPLEGWRRPSSKTINNRTHKQRRFGVRAVRSAHSRTKKKQALTLEVNSFSLEVPKTLAKFSTKFRGAWKTRRTFSSAPDTKRNLPTVARHCMS